MSRLSAIEAVAAAAIHNVIPANAIAALKAHTICIAIARTYRRTTILIAIVRSRPAVVLKVFPRAIDAVVESLTLNLLKVTRRCIPSICRSISRSISRRWRWRALLRYGLGGKRRHHHHSRESKSCKAFVHHFVFLHPTTSRALVNTHLGVESCCGNIGLRFACVFSNICIEVV